MLREKSIPTLSGWLVMPLLIAAFAGGMGWLFQIGHAQAPGAIWMPIALIFGAAISIPGFFVVNPNEGKAVLLFGNYLGTARQQGFHWVSPFTTRVRVSMRVRNFESA